MKQALYSYLNRHKTDVAVISTDQNGIITVFNPCAESLLGYKSTDIIGKPLPVNNLAEVLQQSQDISPNIQFQPLVCENGATLSMEVLSNPILNNQNQVTGYLFTATPIPQVQHDFSLNDLPDREVLAVILDIELKRCERQNQPLAFVHITLDKIDHDKGYLQPKEKETLTQIAYHLNNRIQRASDFLATAFGPEFYLILPATDKSGAVTLCEQLRLLINSLALPHPKNPKNNITASLGICHLFPKRNTCVKFCLDAAKKALHEAVQAGGNCSRLTTNEIK